MTQLLGGCGLSDPQPDDIPPSYERDELPVVSIDTVIVETDYSVSFVYSVEGEVHINTLKLCLTNINQVPDSTDAIVDLLPYYKAGIFRVNVKSLSRNKAYFASLFVANRTENVYSTVKQFTIKSVARNEKWEYVTSIPNLSGLGYVAFKNVFVVKDKAYFISHYVDWLDYGGREMWEYDPAMDVWTRKADFPGALRDFTRVLSIGDKGYIGLGWERIEPGFSETLYDWWMYDPGKDQWIEQASILEDEAYVIASFVVNGMGYIMKSASRTSTYPTNVYAYNPQTNSWIKKSVFSGPKLVDSGSFVIGDRAFIVGGEYWKGDAFLNTCMWEYNYVTDTWKQQGDFPGSARRELKTFVLGDKGYIGWGVEKVSDQAMDFVNDFWIYDPNTNLWKEEILYPSDMPADFGFSIGNEGYILSHGELYRYYPDR